MNIDIHTTLTVNEKIEGEQEESLHANIVFDLDESLGFCNEHLQISPAFTDYYNFYTFGGQKNINLTFRDPWEIKDIQENGLRFFTYCSDCFKLLESSVMSTFMWLGGLGANHYLPMLGNKPTLYQKETNTRFLE